MNELSEDSRCDEEAARLLPWYVVGRLDAGDAERVTRHLERCAVCRDDLAHERSLRALLKSESSLEYAPQPGLAKTLSRIDELEREATAAIPATAKISSKPARRWTAVQWLTAAVLVQAIAVGALGTALFHRSSSETNKEPRYVTLSTPAISAVSGAHIRAVFSPGMPLGALKALLAENALTIIAGPSDAGAYTLAFTDPQTPSTRLDQTIAGLRADARVMFVELAVNDGAGGR
jgi:anti-sigma factor RsiW